MGMVEEFLKTHLSRFLLTKEDTPLNDSSKPIAGKRKHYSLRRKTKKPKEMVLDGKSIILANPSWEIPFFVAEWLIEQGKLTPEKCPIKTRGKRYLVNVIPAHSHRKFIQPKQLSNGLWIEGNLNYENAIRVALELLKYFNYSKDIINIIY